MGTLAPALRPGPPRPRAVVRPRTEEGVVAAVRYAADDRIPLTVGRGMPAPGGVLVDTGGLDGVVVGRDRVVVGAGTTWRRLLALTAARGLAPAALPDDLDRSVGASVVVADVGAHGPVTDHVLALDLVTGGGARLACSPARRPELFDAVRGGLGQIGVVTAVTVALTPVVRACPPPRRRAWLRAFVPEGEVTAVVRQLAGPYDEVRVAPLAPAAVGTPLLRLPGCPRVVRLELAGPAPPDRVGPVRPGAGSLRGRDRAPGQPGPDDGGGLAGALRRPAARPAGGGAADLRSGWAAETGVRAVRGGIAMSRAARVTWGAVAVLAVVVVAAAAGWFGAELPDRQSSSPSSAPTPTPSPTAPPQEGSALTSVSADRDLPGARPGPRRQGGGRSPARGDRRRGRPGHRRRAGRCGAVRLDAGADHRAVRRHTGHHDDQPGRAAGEPPRPRGPARAGGGLTVRVVGTFGAATDTDAGRFVARSPVRVAHLDTAEDGREPATIGERMAWGAVDGNTQRRGLALVR